MTPDPRALAEVIIEDQFRPRLEAAGNPPGLAAAAIDLATDALATRGIQLTKEQLRLLRHTASDSHPDAYLACDVAVEDAAQRAAAGLRTAMASAGTLVDPLEFERAVDADLRDDPELAVRAEFARIPRPITRPKALAWSLPPAPWAGDRDSNDDKWPPVDAVAAEQLTSLPGGADALDRVDDGPHAGWTQLALVEVHDTPPHRYPHKPARRIRLAVGLEIASASPRSGLLPYAGSPYSVWTVPWRRLAPSTDPKVARERLGRREFPLTAIIDASRSQKTHPGTGLGLPAYILGPALPLIAALDLAPTLIAPGFVLSDAAGPGVVARHWRGHLVHDGGYEPLFPAIEGADLIIRPDLFRRLRDYVGDARLLTGVAVDVDTGELPEDDHHDE